MLVQVFDRSGITALHYAARAGRKADVKALLKQKADPMIADLSGQNTLHPTPYTLHPTPYTLHPTPYTLHPEAQRCSSGHDRESALEADGRPHDR